MNMIILSFFSGKADDILVSFTLYRDLSNWYDVQIKSTPLISITLKESVSLVAMTDGVIFFYRFAARTLLLLYFELRLL